MAPGSPPTQLGIKASLWAEAVVTLLCSLLFCDRPGIVTFPCSHPEAGGAERGAIYWGREKRPPAAVANLEPRPRW